MLARARCRIRGGAAGSSRHARRSATQPVGSALRAAARRRSSARRPPSNPLVVWQSAGELPRRGHSGELACSSERFGDRLAKLLGVVASARLPTGFGAPAWRGGRRSRSSRPRATMAIEQPSAASASAAAPMPRGAPTRSAALPETPRSWRTLSRDAGRVPGRLPAAIGRFQRQQRVERQCAICGRGGTATTTRMVRMPPPTQRRWDRRARGGPDSTSRLVGESDDTNGAETRPRISGRQRLLAVSG